MRPTSLDTVKWTVLKGERASKRKQLDHNVRKHPTTPTEYEKSLTCHRCGKPGHAKRTCKSKKKKDDADEANFAGPMFEADCA